MSGWAFQVEPEKRMATARVGSVPELVNMSRPNLSRNQRRPTHIFTTFFFTFWCGWVLFPFISFVFSGTDRRSQDP